MATPESLPPGEPLIPDIHYCSRCCIPETQEGVVFDELGVCQACQASEQKIHIDWRARESELRKLLETAKAAAGDNYDCIIPISGGKDSTFQLHVLVKVYGMKPLAVTFSHNWFSETGLYNLWNCLEAFNVDHIQFTPNRGLVNKLARRSLSGIGDACWHCHSGVGSFPLQVAAKFRIPLLVWGESLAESSGRSSFHCPLMKFDKDYFTKVSAKLRPSEMVSPGITSRDLYPFQLPAQEELEAAGVRGIHLGDYIFWDDERQTEFLRDAYGWRETEIEGTYKGYKSAECIMPGMHDFTCYQKRGYGRASFHASMDVRNGLMTREEGLQMAKEYDTRRPKAMDYYLGITGLSEREFYETMATHRHERIKDVDLPVTESDPKAEAPEPFITSFLRRMRGEGRR